MALERSARPLARCLRCSKHDAKVLPYRTFSSSTPVREDVATEPASPARPPIDPLTVSSPRLERKLFRDQGQLPIASRRRRAALQTSPNIPFVELPYQCFQEARKVLLEDREEKLKEIELERNRIEKLQKKVAVGEQEEREKAHRLQSMRQYLEKLKILADINDPIVKKKFEDGHGDMAKPIYRHLADKKWRSYKRQLLMQRITQMNVVPDVLAAIDPTVATTLSFPSPLVPGKRRLVQHGDIVDSRVSEFAPNLLVQRFEKGEKLYTIAVINPDVPNVQGDSFEYRCHFLACNIPISPTSKLVQLGKLDAESQVVLPWLPAYSQKGRPYQRMSVWILEQPSNERVAPGSGDVAPSKEIDVAKLKAEGSKWTTRENLALRGFVGKFKLQPAGVDLFRTTWDEGTAGVMKRAGIVGWDVEFKRKRIEPLPYQRLKENRYR